MIPLLTTGSACSVVGGDEIAMGVARLTVRNVGAMTTLVNQDATCGFQSPAVLAAAVKEGEVGSPGRVTWTVEGCTIQVPDEMTLSTDCNGRSTMVRGTVTISATRTVEGILTGKLDAPVVPSSSTAATVTIRNAAFSGFSVRVSDSPNSMAMQRGSISAVVAPRLAVGASTGACAISTPNVAFSSIRYGPSTVELTTERGQILAEVTSSDLRATNGVRDEGDNTIAGRMNLAARFAMEPPVPARDVTIPTGDDGKLDPEYDAARFKASYACTADLATPESYQCADLTPRIVDGAARLTVKTFGTLASVLNVNHECGFFSDAVLNAAQVTGAVGSEGTAVLTLDNCHLEFRAGTTVNTDCLDVETQLTGVVVANGTKTIRGRVTGNPQAPIIPTTDEPADFDLTLELENLLVGTSASPNALRVRSGTLTGRMHPRTARSDATGECTITTPMARFQDLTWAQASLAVTGASGTFNVEVASSTLQAVNGTWSGDANALSGSVDTGSATLTVPSDGMGLDPAFSQDAFDEAWQCAQDLALPVSHQCG
ncbi:MAG: hypothetical protein AB2A00_32630 [Myxococcota bacterium]